MQRSQNQEISLSDNHLFLTIFLAVSIISFEVRPYFFISSGCSPDSPNVSRIPTLETGTGYESHTASATAPPRPPIILCSSDVTIAPVFLADFRIVSVSSGLRV